jgi:putative MFS transporter
MSGATPEARAPSSADEAAVGAVLDKLKTFRHAYFLPILLGVIMLFDSWDSVAIAYAMPTMSTEWSLNPLLMGVVISAGFGGQFIGAATLGAFAEKFGRMPVLNIAIITMGVLALVCAFIPSYDWMIALRVVQGIAIGGAMPVAITYINEIAPTKTRGRYFAMFQFLCMAGYPAASIASTYVIPHMGWRWLVALGAAPLVLLPLLWMTAPESPRWLARLGRTDQANKALAKLGGEPAAFSTLAERTAEAAAPQKPKANTLTLFNKELRVRSITITALWFFGLFTNFGLTTWAASIYVKVFHIPIERALLYPAISTTMFLVVIFVVGALMDKFGRRAFAIGGTSIAGVALVTLGLLRPSEEAVIVALVMIGQLAISTSTLVLWPFTAESYPTNARALGMGYCSSIGRGASMLAPLFVGFLLNDGFDISTVFISFGVCALGAFAVWAFATRETAGRTLDTI